MVFIVKIKSSGLGLKLKAGIQVTRGRFSIGNLDSEGQKLTKTNNFPLCCQLRLRTATEWVSCVLCAMALRF